MNALKQKLRFSNVAMALELTPKAFRNWLQRYELHLLSDHKTKGWTEFALGDVSILALTREIVRWGIGVEDANEIAFIFIKRQTGPLWEYRNTPADAMIAALKGTSICLHSPDDPEGPYLIINPHLHGHKPTDFISSLWIQPEAVVGRAFSRIQALEETTA